MCQRRLDIYNRPLSLKLITGGVLKLLASLALSIVSFPDPPPKVLKGGGLGTGGSGDETTLSTQVPSYTLAP